MKKSITGVVALLAGAFVAHSQGTVEFGNYATSAYTYVSLSNNGTKTLLGGSAANTGNFANDTGSGADWTVALYGAAGTPGTGTPVQLDDGSGNPVTATMEVGNPLTDTLPGTWYSSQIGVVPGTTFAGQSATLQVYAWYNNGGTLNSYAAAQAANAPTGFSSTVTATTGGPSSSGGTPSLPSSYGFPAFSVSATTPEPSTIALGIMGASAFLMRLRKKQ